ncbi:MAG TPA: hypothetical protein VK550_22990 [Polyangiaceae bacterium]|nr:hypothetical protein [Polyangiaceae bacterium]
MVRNGLLLTDSGVDTDFDLPPVVDDHRAIGEPTDVPRRSPSRGPPFWRSTVLRQKGLGDVA